MWKRNIRTRLIISFLFIITINLSLPGAYILWYFNRHNVEAMSSSNAINAQVLEQLLGRYMSDVSERSKIDGQLKELAAKNNLRITVIDADGVVLADSWETPATMENHRLRPEVQAAMSGNAASSIIRYSDTIKRQMIYTAIPIHQDGKIVGVVRVANNLDQIDAGFAKIKAALIAALAFTSLLAIVIGVKLARMYTAPLEAITVAAKKIASGDLQERVHLHTGDELELLAHTLNTLTANLDDKINETQAEAQKLALILRYMNNAVILLDRYGRVTTANTMAREIFGITEALMGQHNIHVMGLSVLNQAVNDALRQGQNLVIDLKTMTHGGKRVFQVFLAPILATDHEISGVLTVFHDITAWREIQERQADFVANASHELSTPLTAIKGFAETLLDGALADPELSVKFITIIHTEADRMNRLVKDLLQLAKLNAQEYRQQVVMSPTAVKPLATGILQQLAPDAVRKNITLSLELADDLMVSANPDWLRQVFINLMDNGIKYTPANGVIVLTGRKELNMARFTVTDTGIGIPAQDLPLIFDRFYRVERARSRSSGGTGLGLAIVKFIVEMHGGTIEATSEPGLGATFSFSIPLVAHDPA